jgi:antitoxin component YwqK of YwqJK toxin-antitoxin module
MLMEMRMDYIMYSKLYGYKSGLLHVEYNCILGKKNGLYQEWHDNGQLYIEQKHISDKRVGPRRIWYKNGQLCEE